MPSVYCSERVSKKALNKLLSYFEDGKAELHTFSVYDSDECVIRLSMPPYELTGKSEIYSLSKSFCSTAAGMLIDEGLLSLDDRIVDIFREKCPLEIPENLSAMNVRHLLSMNTGHEKCVMHETAFSSDPISAFLKQPVRYKPGTHFTYNTGATLLLSCIVTKVTGKSLFDFLTERLFDPLGISGVYWNSVAGGYNEGGCGLHASNDDIAKLGLLYLHKGVYNGRRILSEEWVNLASSPVSDNSMAGTGDWGSGYGFQFWMNSREGYRGDGAYGQLCMILPERNMVIAVQSETPDVQIEIDKICEFVERMYDADDEAEIVLPSYPPAVSLQRTSGLEDAVMKFDPNPIGWETLRLYYNDSDDTMHAVVSDGSNESDICAGNGVWEENTVIARRLMPKLVDLMPADNEENCRFAASFTAEDGHIRMAVRYLNSPHRMFFDFSKDAEGAVHLDITPRMFMHEGSSSLTARPAD